jgi:hypothetical protein
VDPVVRNFMLMQVKNENIVLWSAIGGEMDKLQRLTAYKLSVSIFRKWMQEGIITQAEFQKCEVRIAKKYEISLCSIYREIP